MSLYDINVVHVIPGWELTVQCYSFRFFMKDGLLVINSDIVIWQIHCGILQYISDSLYRMVSLWHNIDIVNLHGILQYRSPSPPSQEPSPLLTCPMAGRRDWTQTHGGTTTSTTTRAPPSGSHLSLKQVSHRGNPSQRVYLCFEQFNQKCS